MVGILPFVLTLGTLTVFSGLAFLLSDGKTIFGRDIPSSLSGFARAGVGSGDVKVPMLSITAALVILVCWIIQNIQTSEGVYMQSEE